VARDNLTSYIKARESFRLQVAQRTVPWKLMVPPKFGRKPVTPNVPRGLLTSAIFGALAGAGLAIVRDRMDHVFHSPKELTDGLMVPLLGVVPHLPGREGVTNSQSLAVLDGEERFAIVESLRNLFVNFRLLRADKSVRLVALTSSTQEEGKSMTSALFAQTMAQMGQRVLLVDANMRRPMLHRYLGADNMEGLSSLLSDPQLVLENLVQNIQERLDLLTAGLVPPDPTQLLSSERCSVVVEMIRQLPGYDLVIFDTPPVLLLSDAVLLVEHLDGLLFLVGLSRVNRDLPAQALQRLRDMGVDVLGVLANQPERRGSGSQRFGEKGGYGAYAQSVEPPEGSANGHGLKKRFLPLKAASRTLAHWLDVRS
jgi:capsular exopolysaccharide synthesis family protein